MVRFEVEFCKFSLVEYRDVYGWQWDVYVKVMLEILLCTEKGKSRMYI